MPALYKKPFSFPLVLSLILLCEFFFLFVALSIGSIEGKGILITMGIVVALINARRLTKQ